MVDLIYLGSNSQFFKKHIDPKFSPLSFDIHKGHILCLVKVKGRLNLPLTMPRSLAKIH